MQQVFGLGNTNFTNIIKYSFPGVFFEIAAQVFPGKVHVGSKYIQGELAAIIYGNITKQLVNVHLIGNHGRGSALLVIVQSCNAHQQGKQTIADNSFASYRKVVIFVGNQPYQM